MRRGRILTAVVAAGAVMSISASAAVAASPRQIYADLAQHGKLTKHYSAADLRRAAKDATLQGYGGVEAHVQQVGAQGSSGKPLSATHTAGTLPFTGLQLAVFAALGLALVAGGMLLHRAGRNRSRP